MFVLDMYNRPMVRSQNENLLKFVKRQFFSDVSSAVIRMGSDDVAEITGATTLPEFESLVRESSAAKRWVEMRQDAKRSALRVAEMEVAHV